MESIWRQRENNSFWFRVLFQSRLDIFDWLKVYTGSEIILYYLCLIARPHQNVLTIPKTQQKKTKWSTKNKRVANIIMLNCYKKNWCISEEHIFTRRMKPRKSRQHQINSNHTAHNHHICRLFIYYPIIYFSIEIFRYEFVGHSFYAPRGKIDSLHERERTENPK